MVYLTKLPYSGAQSLDSRQSGQYLMEWIHDCQGLLTMNDDILSITDQRFFMFSNLLPL